MSGFWSKANSDWLNSRYEELTTARRDFIALVAKSPLVLEDANQALIFFTTRLVRFAVLWRDAHI
jgi:hypothetical protein